LENFAKLAEFGITKPQSKICIGLRGASRWQYCDIPQRFRGIHPQSHHATVTQASLDLDNTFCGRPSRSDFCSER